MDEGRPLATHTAIALRARHLIAGCRFVALESSRGLRGDAHHSPVFLFHRAAAAVLATSERFSGVSFFIRAFALLLPSATAAGFFFFAITFMLNVQQNNRKRLIDMLNVQHYIQNYHL